MGNKKQQLRLLFFIALYGAPSAGFIGSGALSL